MKLSDSADLSILGCLSISFIMFILNKMVELMTLNSFTITINAFFYFYTWHFPKVWKNLPSWNANQMRFFLLSIVSPISQVTASASLYFSVCWFFLHCLYFLFLTINDRLIKFLFYFWFSFLCFLTVVRNAFKFLFLKFQNKVQKALN